MRSHGLVSRAECLWSGPSCSRDSGPAARRQSPAETTRTRAGASWLTPEGCRAGWLLALPVPGPSDDLKSPWSGCARKQDSGPIETRSAGGGLCRAGVWLRMRTRRSAPGLAWPAGAASTDSSLRVTPSGESEHRPVATPSRNPGQAAFASWAGCVEVRRWGRLVGEAVLGVSVWSRDSSGPPS